MKCFLVKYKELINISPKAYLVKCYNGSKDVLPKSQCFHTEDGLYVSEWILNQKSIQYNTKKIDFFCKDSDFEELGIYEYRKKNKVFTTKINIPEKINITEIDIDDELAR